MLAQILKWLEYFRYPERWLGRGCGCVVSTLLGIAAGWICYTAHFSLDEKLGRGPTSIILGTCVAAVVFVVWFVGRAIYFRTGRGEKVGISYVGIRVPMDDWLFARRELKRLCSKSNQFSIRLFPEYMTRDRQKWQQFERRYKCSVLVRITVSPSLKADKPPTWKTEFTGSVGNFLDKKFLESSTKHLAAIASSPNIPQSVSELLELKAKSLFDSLLFIAAVINYCKQRCDQAAPLLNALEKRLAQRFAVTQHPRLAVRWLHCQCLLRDSNFGANESIGPERLQAAIANAKAAVELYGKQFPYSTAVLTRNHFFAHELDECTRMADLALHSANDQLTKSHAALNRGVLHLFSSQYNNAATMIDQARRMGMVFDNSLIEFADAAAEMNYESAVFLRCAYRKWSGVEIDPALQQELETWFNGDSSRQGLRRLYLNGMMGNNAAKASHPFKKRKGRGRGRK